MMSEADMQGTWQFQLRIDASAELAATLREGLACPEYEALYDVLRRHDATLKCQFDAFTDYVDEAERLGRDAYPLYRWTKATVENPERKAKYLRVFTVYVDGDEVYGADVADALQLALTSLGGAVGIEGVVRFDTNPANNPRIGA
jgi:hypothetical protein